MVVKEANISLVLDSYDDIFSDFDPRSYSERALSNDFLEECKRASRDKNNKEELELRLSVPKAQSNVKNENVIKKRLMAHFEKHCKEQEKKIASIKRSGLFWVVLGVFIMLGATFLLKYEESFFINFLVIIAEPAGWFTFWEGLGKIFIDAKEKAGEMIFYEKMARINIVFNKY